MRRNYISKEFENLNINGTLSMYDKSSLFSSKMMMIDDEIMVNSNNIIYYQNSKGEQINLQVESSYDSVYLNLIDLKKENIILYKDSYMFNDNYNSSWLIEINYKKILLEYLFGVFKNKRTFEGVFNENTLNNDVNISIRSYIILNILDKYNFDKIDLFLKYNDLNEEGNMIYNNSFNSNIFDDEYKHNEIEKVYKDDNIVRFKFKLKKPSDKYNFNYYYNLKYIRI